jgi:hypothetical protein
MLMHKTVETFWQWLLYLFFYISGFRLPPRRDVAAGHHREPRPELRGLQQHQSPPPHRLDLDQFNPE